MFCGYFAHLYKLHVSIYEIFHRVNKNDANTLSEKQKVAINYNFVYLEEILMIVASREESSPRVLLSDILL